MSLNNNNLDSDDSGDFYSLPSIDDSSSEDSFHSTQSSIPLNIALNSHFSDSLKNFNVIHLNAQSIPAHYPDMLASFESRNIHAILVSESWLKPCLPSTSYSLPGFHLIRNDRIGKGGGGVAIYLRSYIPFTIISLSTQPPSLNAVEHLFIEVMLVHTKILLGVCYSPSLLIDYFSSFECLLENLIPLYSHTIIMGDFNTCLLKRDNRCTKLQSVTETCNLHILPLSATHNIPNCTPSLLDLIIVSSPDLVLKYGQHEADVFSHHDLLFLSFLPIPTKIMLAQSLLLSILDYADASYLDLTEDQLNKLERIQNLAIRFIFGLRKYDHVSEFRSKLKWLPIRFRRNLHIVTLLYCVLFNPMTPSYLKENFKFLGHDRPGIVLRSAGKLILAMPTHRTKYYENSFTIKAICLWNQLPSHIHCAKTVTKFKIDVKNYYLSLCHSNDI